MKEYSTHCGSINVVDGQSSAWPHDPFRQWTERGWKLTTVSIQGGFPHPYEWKYCAIFERDAVSEEAKHG